MAGVSANTMSFSGLKKLLSEYEIASYPLSFPCVRFGKILSFLKAQKTPLYWGGSMLTSFVVLVIPESHPTIQPFKL